MRETLLQRTLRLRALREAAGRVAAPSPNYPALGLQSELRFGKHEGETVEAVLATDPGWIRWAIENIRGFAVDADVEEELRFLDDPRRPAERDC